MRILAAAVGLLFLAGTLFQLLDQFDLVAQPPPGLDAATLVPVIAAATNLAMPIAPFAVVAA